MPDVRPIDANALMDTIRQHEYQLAAQRGTVDYGMFTIGIQQAVDEQPTINPDNLRPHGRWIHLKDDVVSNRFHCSECGHAEASRYSINRRPDGACKADGHGNFYYPPKMNYCPNCGAMMEGKENEDA